MHILQKIDIMLSKLNESAELTWEEVQKLCPKSTSISINSGKYMYRGSKDLQGKFGRAIIRMNRRPSKTDKILSNVLNKAFDSYFGVPLRSASLFCTGSTSFARNFGSLYKIYPSDDFNVYWSPNVKDLTYNLDELEYGKLNPAAYTVLAACLSWPDLTDTIRESTKYQEFIESNFPEFFKDVNDYYEKWEWISGKMKTNYGKVSEVMMSKYPKCLDNLIKDNYKKVNSQTEVVQAINSGNELMITASFYCYEKV